MFVFKDTATTEIYTYGHTLSLHDALPTLLTAALPLRYSFVVQYGAARWPLVGQCLTRMGVIYVNRNDARAGARTTRALMHKLQAGEPLAIFAEGTFKPEHGLLPFKVGAFLIAARCGVAIVPAAIRGPRRLFGGGGRPETGRGG